MRSQRAPIVLKQSLQQQFCANAHGGLQHTLWHAQHVKQESKRELIRFNRFEVHSRFHLGGERKPKLRLFFCFFRKASTPLISLKTAPTAGS
jgi:hypothetical protein